MAVNVPFCTTPPANVTVPNVVCVLAPRSSAPPLVVIEPLVERRSFPPTNRSEPALTVVPPVNEFTPFNVSAPTPLFTRACVPARIALTVPDCATNAVPVAVSVPFCTTPPAKVTVPKVVCELPPRSKTPPLVVIEPLEDNRSLPPLNNKEPALTVVPPVYVFAAVNVVVPVPLCTKPCAPSNTALTVPDCATNAVPVAVSVPFCTTPPANVSVPELL